MIDPKLRALYYIALDVYCGDDGQASLKVIEAGNGFWVYDAIGYPETDQITLNNRAKHKEEALKKIMNMLVSND